MLYVWYFTPRAVGKSRRQLRSSATLERRSLFVFPALRHHELTTDLSQVRNLRPTQVKNKSSSSFILFLLQANYLCSCHTGELRAARHGEFVTLKRLFVCLSCSNCARADDWHRSTNKRNTIDGLLPAQFRMLKFICFAFLRSLI